MLLITYLLVYLKGTIEKKSVVCLYSYNILLKLTGLNCRYRYIHIYICIHKLRDIIFTFTSRVDTKKRKKTLL